jgi:hypothetical protein
MESTFWGITATGWVALGAAFTAILAALTVFLALTGLSTARAAQNSIREVQRDRELGFRPYLSWKLGAGTHVLGVNLGRGPALNTIFCVVDDHGWRWFPELVDFSPGQEVTQADQLVLTAQQGAPPPRPQVGQIVPRKVAFCEDQLGNRYRFLPGKVAADVWRPGEAKPDWVLWYEQTAPIAPADDSQHDRQWISLLAYSRQVVW